MFRTPLIRGFVIAATYVLLMTMLFPITAFAHQSTSSVKLAGFGSLSVNPSSGPPGTVVTVTGSGWNPGGTIELRLFSFSGGDVAQAQIASDGTFSTTFKIPSDAPVGPVSIFGDEADGPSTTTFTVTPSHPQTPTRNPPTLCTSGQDPALTGCIPVFCIGGGSCNGHPNGNTGKPLPPNNDEAIGHCLLDVSLEIAFHLAGVGFVRDGYQVVSAVVSEGRVLVKLAKTSNNPGPASVDLVVTIGETLIPAGSCLDLIPQLRERLLHALTTWASHHKKSSNKKRRHRHP